MRVDLHEQTVAELRHILDAYKRRRAFYQDWCDRPAGSMAEGEYEAQISWAPAASR